MVVSCLYVRFCDDIWLWHKLYIFHYVCIYFLFAFDSSCMSGVDLVYWINSELDSRRRYRS